VGGLEILELVRGERCIEDGGVGGVVGWKQRRTGVEPTRPQRGGQPRGSMEKEWGKWGSRGRAEGRGIDEKKVRMGFRRT